MDCSTPGIPVHHQLPELAQTHVHRVGDAIQPSQLLSSPSPPAFFPFFLSDGADFFLMEVRTLSHPYNVASSFCVPVFPLSTKA